MNHGLCNFQTLDLNDYVTVNYTFVICIFVSFFGLPGTIAVISYLLRTILAALSR